MLYCLKWYFALWLSDFLFIWPRLGLMRIGYESLNCAPCENIWNLEYFHVFSALTYVTGTSKVLIMWAWRPVLSSKPFGLNAWSMCCWRNRWNLCSEKKFNNIIHKIEEITYKSKKNVRRDGVLNIWQTQ